MNWKLVHAVGLGAALLTASLLLSRVHPFGDASLFAGSRSDASASTAELPAGVRAVLMNKCADCHGRGLRPPLYGHLAPASWIMERDVICARAAFDVMSWKQYPPDQQEALRNQIALQARTRRMPPLQYVAVHRGGRLPRLKSFSSRTGQHVLRSRRPPQLPWRPAKVIPPAANSCSRSDVPVVMRLRLTAKGRGSRMFTAGMPRPFPGSPTPMRSARLTLRGTTKGFRSG